jgi:hypothetical protein
VAVFGVEGDLADDPASRAPFLLSLTRHELIHGQTSDFCEGESGPSLRNTMQYAHGANAIHAKSAHHSCTLTTQP